jgi:hypothetical protein
VGCGCKLGSRRSCTKSIVFKNFSFWGAKSSKIRYMDAHTKRRSTGRPRLKARIWPRTSSVTTVIFSIRGGVYWELIAVKKAAGSETATTLH